MARLFPFRSESPAGGDQPRVVDLEDEDADEVFSALSSSTAREIYSTLAEDPGTPSDVADAIDSSIQNVRYHLEKLENAGLVEIVDTWYSSRGNEMSVYATADGPLIVTSDETTASKLKTALSRYLGGVAGLAGASLFVQYGLERYFTPAGGQSGAAPAGSGSDDTVEDGDTRGDDQTGAGTDDATADDVGTATNDETTDDVDTAGDDGSQSPPSEDGGDPGTGEHSGDGIADGEGPENADDGGVITDVLGTVTDVFGDITDGLWGDTPESAEVVFSSVPPGLVFFLGGLVVLTAVIGYWYWTSSY